MENERIGNLIASLRKEKGLTQEALGALVGVSGKAVYRWEKGINLPDVTILNEISASLGITTRELLSGKVDTKIKDSTLKERKNNSKVIIIILGILLVLMMISIVVLFNYFNNKNVSYNYMVSSSNNDIALKGMIYSNKKVTMIGIGGFSLLNKEKNIEGIKAIEILLLQNDKIIYREGQIGDKPPEIDANINFEEYLKEAKIYLRDDMIKFKGNEKDIKIQFNYIDKNDEYASCVVPLRLSLDN